MIRARNDIVIFKPLAIITRTAAGLFLPQRNHEGTQNFLMAEVVAVGPGRRLKRCDSRSQPEIKAGDIVYYDKRIAGKIPTSEGPVYACRLGELLAAVEVSP